VRMGVDRHNALLAVTGGSATGLSATDAWAEPQPVINIDVWASLCAPAGNPDVWPRPSGAGTLTNDFDLKTRPRVDEPQV